jgi:hypothetical protein
LLKWMFSKSEPYKTEDILNNGLHLAMAFGKDWLKPIQSRLANKYPGLSIDELNTYNGQCQEAMKFGHDAVYSMAEKQGKNTSKVEFQLLYSAKYPWVTAKNIKGIFNQGMYYAHKDMGF